MEIIIFGEKIETKKITAIYEVEKYKTRFLNREAGFVVKFMDGTQKTFKENIPYETYASQISQIKRKWNNTRLKVIEKWEQDKLIFIIC